MIDLMYRLIYWVYDIDLKILSINDSGGYYFNDKQLHFIVMGIVGMAMILIIYPIFKLLAKHNMTMVITFIYVFTMMIVLTFSIEIGQWLAGTGRVEMADVTSGLAGFLIMFFIFAVLRGLVRGIAQMVRKNQPAPEGKHWEE
ncbi:MAG: hypothetical protein IKE85_00170 [Mogibacterium sp.]|nr:hypothetical protein [Mogibacterium sp.]